MKIYADASFVTSLYLVDRHSPFALKQFEDIGDSGHQIVVGELVPLEVANAIHLAAFRKAVLPAESLKLVANLDGDLAAGVFRLMPVPVTVWKKAQELSRTYTSEVGCRSLDILQVATAMVLSAELFLTFDTRQRELAIAAGLNAPDLLAAHS